MANQTSEVKTETFIIEATSDEEAQAKAQEIIGTKELEEGKYRIELDPIREYKIHLYQTVENAPAQDETPAQQG